MDPLCAPVLNNWYPKIGELEQRGGSIQWATLAGAPAVRAFAKFSKQDATQKLFACTDLGLYDITAGGLGLAVAQARTFGAESTVNFTNSAGNHFLLGVNGVDTYFSYDGTTFATPTTTGVTTSTLTQLFIFKRRVWAVQKNTQSVWYLDIDSIAGTWIEFPIGALLTKGGYLVAGSNWTLDGGTGSDDNLILISSEGEVLVYQGSSPAAASLSNLSGYTRLESRSRNTASRRSQGMY